MNDKSKANSAESQEVQGAVVMNQKVVANLAELQDDNSVIARCLTSELGDVIEWLACESNDRPEEWERLIDSVSNARRVIRGFIV